MKKYEGVLKRVKEIEWKYGIAYARPDEKLYKIIRFFYFIMFLWLIIMNVMHVISIWIKEMENVQTIADDFGEGTAVVGVCTVVLIFAFILKCFKNIYCHISAFVITVASCVWLFFTYSPWFAELDGLWGYKEEFYLRLIIPFVLLPLLMAILVFIYVRAEIKTDRLYKKVHEELYKRKGMGSDGVAAMNDSDWEEFIKSYDPRVERENAKKKKTEKYDEQF